MYNIRPSAFLMLQLSTLALLGCQAKDKGPNIVNVCGSNDAPSGCGQSCGAANPVNPICGQGLFCSGDNKCNAECRPDQQTCGNGYACTTSGQCKATSTLAQAQTQTDGSTSCGNIVLDTNRRRPNVVMLIDRSSSMTVKLSNNSSSRWVEMRNFLVGSSDNQGLVYDLQDDVSFGFVSYSSGRNQCPELRPSNLIQPAASNYATIRAQYMSQSPTSNTPTGESVREVVKQLAAVDPNGNPTILLLATDGDPDTCADPDSNGTQPPKDLTVQEVTKARTEKGILTYVVGVGLGSVEEAHLDAVAVAGTGKAASKKWIVGDVAGLKSAFSEIINPFVSCKFDLTGSVKPSEACDQGKVSINKTGVPLECGNTSRGWQVIPDASDPNRAVSIELLGSACTDYKANPSPSVQAEFPCNVVTSTR